MKIILVTFIILTMTSCKMFIDTEGYDIKSKYNKDNIVFKTNSKFNYSTYRLKGEDTLDCYLIYLNDTVIIKQVELTVIPGKFFAQTKIKWEYIDENGDKLGLSITGIDENSSGIWIHPPRTGIPFIYTESAPFPEIHYPLDSMKIWKSGLIGLKGYESIGLKGEVKFEYTISEKRDIQTNYKLFQNCWVVNSIGESSIGVSNHIFFFDEKYGFVHSEYSFPTGERLILTLNNYKEK